jgi:NodT family efflux transporter outer membrane factor (OMF) lipoprotein
MPRLAEFVRRRKSPADNDLSAGSLRLLALAGMVAVLGACAAGPDFRPPDAPDVDAWRADAVPAETVSSDAPTGDAQRFLEGGEIESNWWTTFDNAELDRRIEAALAHSPSIASAQAALREAQENVAVARGPLWPGIDAKAGANRQKSSGASFGGAGGAQIGSSTYTLYNASVDVGYTLDLFGANRRGVEAQAALADFQYFQLQGTYLALTANVATASFREAALLEQIGANEEVISLLDEQLDLIETQHEIGVVSMADVLVARSEIATARAQLPALRQALDQTRNQLAVYMGRFPSEAGLGEIDLDALTLPRDIPLSLPSQLTRQRPDLLAAEAQLHRATAAVGIATANLFPQIILSASYGSQALEGSDLFSSGTTAWGIGLNLLQPLFHGGELRARKRAAEAGLDRVAADYRETVLTAFQNVADSLRALELDAEALAAQADAEEAAQRSLELVRVQYRDGATSYLQVLDATRQYQQARIGLAQARGARLTDTAALFVALGGGWSTESGLDPALSEQSEPSDGEASSPPQTGEED